MGCLDLERFPHTKCNKLFAPTNRALNDTIAAHPSDCIRRRRLSQSDAKVVTTRELNTHELLYNNEAATSMNMEIQSPV